MAAHSHRPGNQLIWRCRRRFAADRQQVRWLSTESKWVSYL